MRITREPETFAFRELSRSDLLALQYGLEAHIKDVYKDSNDARLNGSRSQAMLDLILVSLSGG